MATEAPTPESSPQVSAQRSRGLPDRRPLLRQNSVWMERAVLLPPAKRHDQSRSPPWHSRRRVVVLGSGEL